MASVDGIISFVIFATCLTFTPAETSKRKIGL